MRVIVAVSLARELTLRPSRKFLFLFIFGLRMRAIAILGREVMLPRGLVGLGLDTLDQSGPEIFEVCCIGRVKMRVPV